MSASLIIVARVPKDIARWVPYKAEDTSAPHVTLLYVGKVDPSRVGHVLDAIRCVLVGVRPLEMLFDGVGYFDGADERIAFLRVVASAQLLALHDALRSAISRIGIEPAHVVDGGYTPHVTLAYLEPGEMYDGSVPPHVGWMAQSVEVWCGDFVMTLPIPAAAPAASGTRSAIEELARVQEDRAREVAALPASRCRCRGSSGAGTDLRRRLCRSVQGDRVNPIVAPRHHPQDRTASPGVGACSSPGAWLVTALGEAVERAARALGVWGGDRSRECVRVDGPFTLARMPSGQYVCGKTNNDARHLDDLTAALVLLCHGLPETEKQCPDCPPSVGPILFGTREDAREWRRQNRRYKTTQIRRDKITKQWGLWVGEAAEWLLWSDIRRVCKTCSPALGDGKRGEPTGNPRARERIAVLADDRQAQGDPLGEWLALWLNAVPCRACYRIREDGSESRGAGGCGWRGGVPGNGHPDCPRCDGDGSCPSCRGSGLELGAHTQAIIEALTRV